MLFSCPLWLAGCSFGKCFERIFFRTGKKFWKIYFVVLANVLKGYLVCARDASCRTCVAPVLGELCLRNGVSCCATLYQSLFGFLPELFWICSQFFFRFQISFWIFLDFLKIFIFTVLYELCLRNGVRSCATLYMRVARQASRSQAGVETAHGLGDFVSVCSKVGEGRGLLSLNSGGCTG